MLNNQITIQKDVFINSKFNNLALKVRLIPLQNNQLGLLPSKKFIQIILIFS